MRRRWSLLIVALLAACRLPDGAASPTPAGMGGASDGAQVSRVAEQQALTTAISGRVDFSGRYGVAATPAEVVKYATLSLIDLSTNATVVVDKTDASGNFTLGLNGYVPDSNTTYLLEATKGLNQNGAGYTNARLRTYVRWSGAAWTSINTGGIIINTLTTALALISNMDAGVTAKSLIGRVNGTSLLSAPSGYTSGDVTDLAASLAAFITNDMDPVEGVSKFAPSISGISPGHAPVNNAITLTGAGFSPVAGDNVVLFAGNATGSVFMASPTRIIVLVPSGASSGNVTVKTRNKTSNVQSFTVDPGGGGGGGIGFGITSISPPNGVPGDFLTVTGDGFSPVAANNTVYFEGTITVTAIPTYADPHALIVAIPTSASSGPAYVKVGGNCTNKFYVNVNVATITGFAPPAGSPNSTVTVSGQNFGSQGMQSAVKFNGNTNQASIVSWGAAQVNAIVPGPSLAAKVSGPLTLVTSAGGLSQPFGTFAASTSIVEGFTGGAGTGTNASWSGGTLQPATAVNTFNQTDFSGNSNSADAKADASGLTLKPWARAVGGFVPAISWYAAQLGVDNTYFYFNAGGYVVNRYRLSDGAYVDNATPGNSCREIIWDPQNNCYVAGSYDGAGYMYKFTSWGSFAPLNGVFQNGHGNTYLAANGSAYLTDWNGSSYVPGTWNTSFGFIGQYTSSPISSFYRFAAAGFKGLNEYLLTPDKSINSISSLDRLTLNNHAPAAVALPFSIDGTGLVTSETAPSIGSDGTSLFALGRNAGYNGNALSLFKFSYSSGASAVTLQPFNTTVTSTTPAINLPANSIWDMVSFARNVPNGSCVIDVLDGSNTVLAANVASGYDLNGITAGTIKLRATITGTNALSAPSVSAWSVKTRPAFAISPAYDSGTNFATYQAPAITSSGVTGADYTITYSGSNDGNVWGTDVANFATLNQRYVRFKVNFKKSSTTITRLELPYTY